ncbi:hypothetical protein Emed_001469 [Eimeria media]
MHACVIKSSSSSSSSPAVIPAAAAWPYDHLPAAPCEEAFPARLLHTAPPLAHEAAAAPAAAAIAAAAAAAEDAAGRGCATPTHTQPDKTSSFWQIQKSLLQQQQEQQQQLGNLLRSQLKKHACMHACTQQIGLFLSREGLYPWLSALASRERETSFLGLHACGCVQGPASSPSASR